MKTRKPCPGCGEVDRWREADKVCGSCARRLEEMNQLESAQPNNEEVLIAFGERYHWNKYIHTKGGIESSEIMKAFQRLAESACRPAFNGDPEFYLLGEVDRGSLGKLFVAKRDLAEAIRDLRLLIQPLIDSVYESGKRDGHNLLMRLASGDLSPNQYLKKTEEESS